MSSTTATKPTPPDVINIVRLELGLTDDALAIESGIPRSTLRTKIRNIDLFTIGELKRIGPALGVDYKSWLEEAA